MKDAPKIWKKLSKSKIFDALGNSWNYPRGANTVCLLASIME